MVSLCIVIQLEIFSNSARSNWLLRGHLTYNNGGAHNPERASSMRSCHGVFAGQFIFRTVLAQILNIF